MKDLYDIINALRIEHDMDMKQLALKTNIKYTTFVSFMHRRPAKLRRSHLIAIGKEFEIPWYQLLNKTPSFAKKQNMVPVSMTLEEVKQVADRCIQKKMKTLTKPHKTYEIIYKEELYHHFYIEAETEEEAKERFYKNADEFDYSDGECYDSEIVSCEEVK